MLDWVLFIDLKDLRKRTLKSEKTFFTIGRLKMFRFVFDVILWSFNCVLRSLGEESDPWFMMRDIYVRSTWSHIGSLFWTAQRKGETMVDCHYPEQLKPF